MQALAMVSSTGNVFWPPIVKYRGNCEIKIKFFPYDDQVRINLFAKYIHKLLFSFKTLLTSNINMYVRSANHEQHR